MRGLMATGLYLAGIALGAKEKWEEYLLVLPLSARPLVQGAGQVSMRLATI